MAIKSRNKVSVAFSMSSLTDIVFLLLIFFIIISTLINPYGEHVDLPNSSSRTTKKPSFSISITKNLDYFVGDEKVGAEMVENYLVKHFENTNQEKTAVLYVDESVPTGFTINMFAMARKHGVDMVVATEPKLE